MRTSVLHIPACILCEVIIAGEIRYFLIVVVLFLFCFENRVVPSEVNETLIRNTGLICKTEL